MKCKMCPVHMVAGVLVLVGALNWGIVGFFEFNLVSYLVGSMITLEHVIYGLVGIAAILMLFVCKCGKCNTYKSGEGSCCNAGEKKM